MSLFETTLVEFQEELHRLETIFDANGGRGVSLADEIDAYRTAVDILNGEETVCPNCLEGSIPVFPEEERVAKAHGTLVQEVLCKGCGRF